jgi:hypothetical protein
MSDHLTDTEKAIVQQVRLDKWNPHRLDRKIASHFAMTIDEVRHTRGKAAFVAECERQSAISRQTFVTLADRKERAIALQGLFERVPEMRRALRMKILKQIREEVLDDKLQHVHEAPAPPQAQTYAEWPSSRSALTE